MTLWRYAFCAASLGSRIRSVKVIFHLRNMIQQCRSGRHNQLKNGIRSQHVVTGFRKSAKEELTLLTSRRVSCQYQSFRGLNSSRSVNKSSILLRLSKYRSEEHTSELQSRLHL